MTNQPQGKTARTDLHGAIMNIPCSPKLPGNFSEHCYKLGHRDACHAAAELADATLADLAMMMRMLLSRLTTLSKQAGHEAADEDLAGRAMNLLRKHGLQGSPLRDEGNVGAAALPALQVQPPVDVDALTRSWLNSLERGAELCGRHAHQGDAARLRDLAQALAARASATQLPAHAQEALRLADEIAEEVHPATVWRVMNAAEDGFCMEFSSRDHLNPERECRKWLDQQRPDWIQANGYHAVKQEHYRSAERLAVAAAALLRRLHPDFISPATAPMSATTIEPGT
jgi:hypothetical protein